MLARRIKIFSIALSLLLAFSLKSYSDILPGDKAGLAADRYYKALNLSDDQYSKVYGVLLTYYTKQADHMKEFKKDRNACMEACKKDWETVKSAMSGILNKDQLATYNSMPDKFMMMNPMMKNRHHKTDSNSGTSDTTKDKVKNDKEKANQKSDEVKKDTKK